MIRCLILMLFCVASTNAQSVFFSGGPTVNIRDFGAVPNDGVLDTPALVAAMSGGGRTVLIPAGEYLVSTFEIPSNTVLEFAISVVLRDSGTLSPIQRLVNIRSQNVRIVGNGVRIIADRSVYTTGEQRHGILLLGAKNVEISGVESSGHGGDGFAIGAASTDITIRDSISSNNRRQGMSIISAVNLLVSNCMFSDTKGTWPMFGIDVEPNNSGDVIQNVRFNQIRTWRNTGGGITVDTSNLGSSPKPATVFISDQTSVGESIVFRQGTIRAIDRVSYELKLDELVN